MIRINLLPYHETEKKVSQAKQVVLLVGSLLLFVACIAILHLYMVARITLLEGDIKAGEQELAALKKIVGNIEDYKTDKRLLEKKIDVIEKLEKDRTFPVFMLEELTEIVPVKDLWLDKVSQTATMLTIEGKARNTVVVAHFMSALESLPFLSSVDLVSSKQETISGVNVQTFRFNCAIKKG